MCFLGKNVYSILEQLFFLKFFACPWKLKHITWIYVSVFLYVSFFPIWKCHSCIYSSTELTAKKKLKHLQSVQRALIFLRESSVPFHTRQVYDGIDWLHSSSGRDVWYIMDVNNLRFMFSQVWLGSEQLCRLQFTLTVHDFWKFFWKKKRHVKRIFLKEYLTVCLLLR